MAPAVAQTGYGPLESHAQGEGSLGGTPLSQKGRKQPARKKMRVDDSAPVVHGERMTNEDDQGDTEVGERANRLWSALKAGGITRESQTPLVRVVWQPKSFTQTVENLFDASFLVKFGSAELFVAETGELCIGAVTSADQQELEKDAAAQSSVLSFDQTQIDEYARKHLKPGVAYTPFLSRAYFAQTCRRCVRLTPCAQSAWQMRPLAPSGSGKRGVLFSLVYLVRKSKDEPDEHVVLLLHQPVLHINKLAVLLLRCRHEQLLDRHIVLVVRLAVVHQDAERGEGAQVLAHRRHRVHSSAVIEEDAH